MKISESFLISILLCCSAVIADTHYVDIDNETPSAPYTSWNTAANDIQSAIDEAVAGDVVLVTNGVYHITSQINVPKNIEVRSVNGSDSAIIDAGGNVRCFYVTSTCQVVGFTITGGHTTSNGGGVYCSNNDAKITYCTITNCLSGGYGGGVYKGDVRNCCIRNNQAERGGGLYLAEVRNCEISGNTADRGGGIYSGFAINCTISGNRAVFAGGGARFTNVDNSIIWYNTSELNIGNNLYDVTVHFSCSPSLEHGSDGNITNTPLLASSSHISINSPCRNAGNTTYSSEVDLDGEAWLSPPAMGCDEHHESESIDGTLTLALIGETNIVTGFPVNYYAHIQGAATSSTANYGDGIITTNQLGKAKTWHLPGDYEVTLSAYNDEHPAGISNTQTVHVSSVEATTIHISDATGDDANDGLSWALPKKSIQAGIDAQDLYGGAVLVTDGVYSVSSQIVIDKIIQFSSLNGPEYTVVDAGGSNRCFYLTIGSVNGFTIRNGYASSGLNSKGGGVYGGRVNNCIITGNVASVSYPVSFGYGGGLFGCEANHCIIRNNRANLGGGGTSGTTVHNSIISDNSAGRGGGMLAGTANNCTIVGNGSGGTSEVEVNNSIVYYNYGESDILLGTVSNSCSPYLTHGVDGNITNAPLFVGAGNYHLAPDSPCINAGANENVNETTDLDGNPRISGDAVDMGAYEYQIGLITSCSPIASGFKLEWNNLLDCDSVIKYSTNLVTMPFADRSVPLPHPMNCYTDLVHGAESECFYKIEIQP